MTSERRAQKHYQRMKSRGVERYRKVISRCARCGQCELWHGRFFRTHGHVYATCKRFVAK